MAPNQKQVLAAPGSKLGWGALLLVTGFVLLLAGIAINWKLRDDADPLEVPEDPGR